MAVYSEGLSLELEAYGYVDGKNTYFEDPRREKYETAFLALADVMDSPVWNRGAILSQKHREGNRLFRQNYF